jgi:hypothetical protein
MSRTPRASAVATILSGGQSSPMGRSKRPSGLTENSRNWEICQFWQKAQKRLHPTVPRERIPSPGWKW